RFSFGSGSAFLRIRPSVTVTVPALTLLGVSDDPGTLEGYGPIDADTARALAGQSDVWYRILTDPKTGAPIAMDRTKYRPTKPMKRYLRYRDGTCRFPGCNRAARHCDLDHTNDRQHGGPTECENLAHLCRKHHRLKHQTISKVKQLGAGTLEWTSPGGRNYITQPDVLLTTPESPPEHREETDSPPPVPPTPPTPGDPPPF
ncbi:MAG: HNH endonuclease, partial [Mycetocola sp.]